MQDFVIFTDSGCDLTKERLAEWGIEQFSFAVGSNTTGEEYTDATAPTVSEIYERMREGETFRTSAASIGFLHDAIAPTLAAGRDLLYLSFGSGLSSNFHTAELAVEELAAEFPDRRVRVIDTLSASAGQALLLYLAARARAAGKTFDETADYIDEIRHRVAHRFTVHELKYLQRGGRCSAAAAVAGTMLGIKPLMRLDEAGKMEVVGKIRGRRPALEATVAHCLAHAEKDSPVFISHAGCPEDAETVAGLLRAGGKEVIDICEITPVIGVHSGPGTVALFYLSDER